MLLISSGKPDSDNDKLREGGREGGREGARSVQVQQQPYKNV